MKKVRYYILLGALIIVQTASIYINSVLRTNLDRATKTIQIQDGAIRAQNRAILAQGRTIETLRQQYCDSDSYFRDLESLGITDGLIQDGGRAKR